MTDPVHDQPQLPLVGDELDGMYETVIASMWSTEDPDEDGAYTCHLLTLTSDCDFWVGLWAWDEELEEWSVTTGTKFGAIAPAARHWADLTGDDD